VQSFKYGNTRPRTHIHTRAYQYTFYKVYKDTIRVQHKFYPYNNEVILCHIFFIIIYALFSGYLFYILSSLSQNMILINFFEAFNESIEYNNLLSIKRYKFNMYSHYAKHILFNFILFFFSFSFFKYVKGTVEHKEYYNMK
jgi:hypothetical protein